MKVSELAKILSVTSDTVRFYTREGLLKPVKSEDNGYKQYGRKELNRLRFIESSGNVKIRRSTRSLCWETAKFGDYVQNQTFLSVD